MQIFLFLSLSIAALAVLFALQNSTPVEVTFLAWTFESSLAMVLLVALATGALISYLFSMPGSVRDRWMIRQQRKKMDEMEASLADTKARLEDAEARSELLKSKLTLLDTGANSEETQLSAGEDLPPAKPPMGMATGRTIATD